MGGAYVVDCFVRTPVLPAWDAEYEVRSVRTSPGGKALNQAVALARLGVQVWQWAWWLVRPKPGQWTRLSGRQYWRSAVRVATSPCRSANYLLAYAF